MCHAGGVRRPQGGNGGGTPGPTLSPDPTLWQPEVKLAMPDIDDDDGDSLPTVGSTLVICPYMGLFQGEVPA
jgi:hypothetical protein